MSSDGKKRFGLGRGIGALMDDYSFEGVYPEGEERQQLVYLDINVVRPNANQPRKKFDQTTIDELATSILNQGILQPLLVEKQRDDEYVIVAGERRYRAALQAGLEKVPVIIKSFSEVQRHEVSLIENIQRENLNAVEEARAYAYLLEQAEINQEELAQRVGKSRSAIANSVRLLNLPRVILNSLADGEITAGHGRALLSVINPADQEVLYQRILDKDLSVRESERLAQEFNHGKRIATVSKKTHQVAKSADILAIESKFLHIFGTRVELKGSLERGKLEITYHSYEDLERIYAIIDPDESLFGI